MGFVFVKFLFLFDLVLYLGLLVAAAGGLCLCGWLSRWILFLECCWFCWILSWVCVFVGYEFGVFDLILMLWFVLFVGLFGVAFDVCFASFDCRFVFVNFVGYF